MAPRLAQLGFALLVLSTCTATSRAAIDAEGAKHAHEFLNQYCADCHGEDAQKGKFRADTLPTDLNAPDAAKLWGRVLTRLEAGEMPPPKKIRPPRDRVAATLSWTKTALAAEAKARRADGRTAIRRLNRYEYENTIHDLLGIQTQLQDLLPMDDSANGFDTAASALSISPVHIQRYMDAAELALRSAIIRQPRPEVITQRFVYFHEKEKWFTDHYCNSPMIRPRNGNELWFFTEPHIEVPAILNQFADVTRKTPGRYRVRVSTYAHDSNNQRLVFAIMTTQSKQLLGFFDALPEKPAVTEVDFWFAPGDTIVVAPYRLNLARIDRGLSIYAPKPWTEPVGPALAVQWVETQGPIIDAWPPVGQRRLFGDVPLKAFKETPNEVVLPGPLAQLRYSDQVTPVSAAPEADAKKLLGEFLARAFRRPVAEDDVKPYLDIVARHLQQKECFESAMMSAYQAALCSPDFLFLVEEPGKLTDHALASRLSYFLWRSQPDDELRAAADRGELHQPDVLRRQADRLLASPRSKAFIEDFLDQWLRLREMDATMPDKVLFPEFFENVFSAKVDGLLRDSAAKETRLFFTDLLSTDASLLKLIDSDYTYLNSRLAEHYGLPPVEGAALRRVMLPPNSVRGGVITQASVLKVTANGAITSPVLRGAFVMDNIIGRPVPPPPPNIGAIEPDTRGATTIRERLSKHQSNDSCAACHSKLDPPGFALEAFDPVGQLRDYYRTTELGELVKANTRDCTAQPVAYHHGAPVDPAGKLPDGQAFAGPREFKQLVLQQPDAVTRCLAGKLVTFATGNHTEAGDVLALDAIVARAKAHQYGLRSLVHEVIQSDLFLEK